ncbi:hypothetical protein CC86DRAFT_435968 [Ophiobolus disseminans]|uniref:Uncharacterized protein n=1 Tax=Ophiobolus disseminans TaxID=1469910 RepID=A0A6A7A9J8_9PLEO|nr:hypothetical protein CC86DRAFT_435968 [Ophiobolus disseminans]
MSTPERSRPWREDLQTRTRRSKERRSDESSVANKSYNATEINNAIQGIADTHNTFYTTFERLVAGPNFKSQPNIHGISQALHAQFNGVQESVRRFNEDLKEEHEAILKGVDVAFEAFTAAACDNDWWESVNVLSPARQPTEPVVYGQRIQDMYLEAMAETVEHKPSYHQRTLAPYTRPILERNPVLFVEIMRISNMPNGDATAFKLFLDLQLGLWPSKVTQNFSCDLIHEKLLAILEKDHTPHDVPFFALAAACRATKERLASKQCTQGRNETIPDDNYCMYNKLPPTLDLLQRHAYFEIQSNVRLAVGDYLPPELEQFIFEYTLDAEDVARDPRVIVRATDTSADSVLNITVLEKCLLPCDHDLRDLPVPRPGRAYTALSRERSFARVGKFHSYVHGPKYEPCLAGIPKSITSHKELLDAEFLAGLHKAPAVDDDALQDAGAGL